MTDEQFQIFCDSISHGKSIDDSLLACKTAWATLQKYLDEHGEKSERKYARAREKYLEEHLTKRESIIDKYKKEILANPQCANALSSMCREECRQIEWELSRRMPRKYGDRIQVDADLSHHVVRLPAKKGEA
jgi:hypothetical protein